MLYSYCSLSWNDINKWASTFIKVFFPAYSFMMAFLCLLFCCRWCTFRPLFFVVPISYFYVLQNDLLTVPKRTLNEHLTVSLFSPLLNTEIGKRSHRESSHRFGDWNSRISSNTIRILKYNYSFFLNHILMENIWKPDFCGWLVGLSLSFPAPKDIKT